MRFKKLKIILGIFLIVFLLIVANTVAFGLLHEKLVVPIDNSKSNSERTNIVIQKNDTTSSTSTETSTTASSPSSTAQSTNQPAPTPQVVVHTRRTRAS